MSFHSEIHLDMHMNKFASQQILSPRYRKVILMLTPRDHHLLLINWLGSIGHDHQLNNKRKKLQQLWTGPWQILSFQSTLVVKIRHTKTHKTQTVHVDRLIPCHNQSPPPDSLPTPTVTTPTTLTPVITSSLATTPTSIILTSIPTAEHQSSSPPTTPVPTRISTRQRRIPKYLNSYVAVWLLSNTPFSKKK